LLFVGRAAELPDQAGSAPSWSPAWSPGSSAAGLVAGLVAGQLGLDLWITSKIVWK
jgi:hypothetical protein